MKKYILPLFFIFASVFTFGQSVQSIEKPIKRTDTELKNDTEKIPTSFEKSVNSHQSNGMIEASGHSNLLIDKVHYLLRETNDDFARIRMINQKSQTIGDSFWDISGYLGTNISDDVFHIYNGRSASNILSIRGDGKVGIGTTTPTGNLHIVGTGSASGSSSTTDPVLRMGITNDANFGWIRFENSTGTRHFSQRFDLFSSIAASNSYAMYYGSDKLFTVKGDGKFGLNVASPLDLLHLSPISNTGDVYARISSTTGLAGVRLQNAASDWSLYTNEFSKLFIGYSADDFATNAQVLVFEPNGTNFNMVPSTNNQVLLGTTSLRWRETNTAGLDVSGFTKLGDDVAAPKIKMKKLTLTNGAAGVTSSVAHGLTQSKILSVSVLINASTTNDIPPRSTYTGFEYDYYVSSSNIVIKNISGNDVSIVGRPIRILITYEE